MSELKAKIVTQLSKDMLDIINEMAGEVKCEIVRQELKDMIEFDEDQDFIDAAKKVLSAYTSTMHL